MDYDVRSFLMRRMQKAYLLSQWLVLRRCRPQYRLFSVFDRCEANNELNSTATEPVVLVTKVSSRHLPGDTEKTARDLAV
jgi:hypothetical protein